MTKFESTVKVISAIAKKRVYEKLSDLSNLEKVKDRLPQDKVKNLSFDAETLSIEVPPVGKTDYCRIVEKRTLQVHQVCNNQSRLYLLTCGYRLWPYTETECKMKVTIGMEIESVYENHGTETFAWKDWRKWLRLLSLIKY